MDAPSYVQESPIDSEGLRGATNRAEYCKLKHR